MSNEVTKIKDILRNTPRGEAIPVEYNERIISIIVKLLPDIEKRIHIFDDFIRKNRIFGKSSICDEEGKIQTSLESRSGIILKAYVKTAIYDENKNLAGIVERSILNDSIQLRNSENNNHSLKEDS